MWPGYLRSLLALAAAAALAPTAHALHPYCNANNIDPATYVPLHNAKLVHVQAVFRHDDRAPHHKQLNPLDQPPWTCPGHVSLEQSDCRKSDLTTKGYSQMAVRGRAFRAIYGDRLQFLPSAYSSAHIHVRSTKTARTMLSARAFLTAAYPETQATFQTWEKLRAVINVGAPGYDTLHHQPCPRRDAYWKAMVKSEELVEYLTERAGWERNQRLAQHLDTVKRHMNIAEVADNIMTRHCHNFALPTLPGSVAINAEIVAAEAQHWSLREKEIIHRSPLSNACNRLNHGEFINELRNFLIMKTVHGPFLREGLHKSEFYRQAMVGYMGTIAAHAGQAEIFFSHDDLLIGLLGLFSAKDLSWPAYGSSFVIELWRQNPTVSHSSHTTISLTDDLGMSFVNVPVRPSTPATTHQMGRANVIYAENDGYASRDSSIPTPKPLETPRISVKTLPHDALFGPYIVRILYNNQPLESNFEWCSFAKGCPLLAFLQHTENMIVRDHASECALPDNRT